MRITYFSDVHLEFGSCLFPEHDGDIVVAAGDIAPGVNALPWLMQSNDIPVVYVAGNHEFYGCDSSSALALLRSKSKDSNVINFLDRDIFEYQGVRFLGTTLWAGFNHGDRVAMHNLENQMNDFAYIKCGYRKMRAQDMLRSHQASLIWLIDQLEIKFDGPTVVVTHYAPSMKSWHLEQTDQRRHAYCSDLDYLASRYDIDLWIHGHTHVRRQYTIGNNTVVACNARGYYGVETDKVGLVPETIEITAG